MQQVKIFKSIETDVAALEAEVNEWIRQSGVRITGMTGNIAPQSGASEGSSGRGLSNSPFPPSDVVLILLYETAEP